MTVKLTALNETNRQEINSLLNEVGASIYSHHRFLEVVAENWLVARSSSGGFLILPYKKKLGVKWIYMPFFYQHSTWFGRWTDEEKRQLFQLLQKEFRGGYLCVSEPFPGIPAEEKKYQVIPTAASYNLNTLAKRMLKKAEQHGFMSINECHVRDYLRLIHTEYAKKFSFWKGDLTRVFDNLITQIAQDRSFRFFGLVDKGELVAGLVTLNHGDRAIYLKGAATEEARLHGAMYLLMDQAIRAAHQEGRLFDFGGSSVEGVARFNHNFGATDATYAVYKWENFPVWFNFLKRLRKK
jgi:hypothetical protein